MTIYEKIQRDKLARGAKRNILSLIMSEICLDGKPMNDDNAIKILVILKKNSKKTYFLYLEKGELVAASEERIFQETLSQYIPKGATYDDIVEALNVLGLERDMRSMGPVMKHLKKNFQVVDGNLVKNYLTRITYDYKVEEYERIQAK